MSIYINMPDPKRQLTREINRKGLATPLNSIIREILINGSEANRRKLGQERGKIHVQRDDFQTNKISITNVGGDFFSEDEAKNNLNTMGNSGNESHEAITGLASNMGQGAKISYLPHCREGILYVSKDSDNEGHTFHLKLIEDSEYYGLQSKWCGYHEDNLEFQYRDFFNSVLEESPFTGTTAVLMGSHLEEDTWKTMCFECSPKEQKTSAGWSLYKFISNRLFRDIGDDIYVDIYSTENEAQLQRTQRVLTTFEIMSQSTSYSSVILTGDEIPKGTVLHYCLKEDFYNQSSSSKHVALNGNIYFAWKKENYFDMSDNGATRSSKLRQCGIWHKATEWILVVELPCDWQGHPSENRTQLSNINEFAFYAAIRDNLPKEISDWMSKNAHKDVDYKDVSKWLKEAFKNYVKDLPTLSRASGNSDNNDDPPSNQVGSKNSDNNDGRPASKTKKRNVSKKRSLEKLKSFQNPHVEIVEEEDGPLLEFMFEPYTILLNTSHPLYSNREKRFIDEYQHVDSIPIKDQVIKHHLKGAMSRIFDVQSQYSKQSVGERKQKWVPDVLEATWNHDSSNAVRRNLGRHSKKSLAAK